MSSQHLDCLRKELAAHHWVVARESRPGDDDEDFTWNIERPNGDSPLTIQFTPARAGKFGGGEIIESFDEVFAACIVLHEDVASLYFGRLTGQFLKDVPAFVAALSQIESS